MQDRNTNPKADNLEAVKNTIPAERRMATALRDGKIALAIAALGICAGAALTARADFGSRRETRLDKARVERLKAHHERPAPAAAANDDAIELVAFTLGEPMIEKSHGDAAAEIDFAMAAPFLEKGTQPAAASATAEPAADECKAPQGGCCSFIVEAVQEAMRDEAARAAGETLSALPL